MHWIRTLAMFFIMVKVVAIHHGTRVDFKLPVHYSTIVAELDADEPSVGVEEGKFYEMRMKDDYIIVKVGKRNVKFWPKKVMFEAQ